MSDSEEDDVYASRLGAVECDRLCNEFASITDTNTVVAMMFLQRNMWDLQGSLETYFNQFTKGDDRPLSARLKEEGKKKNDNQGSSSKAASASSSKSSSSRSSVQRPPSSLVGNQKVKILSWNTDGIDECEPKARAGCCSDVILKELPDVLMLQEVTHRTIEVFDDRLDTTYELSYGDFGAEYFTAIGIKKDCGVMEGHSFQPFNTSMMGRGLQIADVKIHGAPITVITSHLESMKDYEQERVRQLRMMLNNAKDIDIGRVVFAGGDLNLRDKELQLAGGIPRKFYDAWEATGKREIARWTWDLQRNDNHRMEHARFQPHARFDRIYFRSADDVKCNPVYFELVGLERTSPLRRFPSDHWGLLFHADLSCATPTA